MKKLILIMTGIAITLSSCLKDSKTTVNFTKAGNIVNFPLSGVANFGNDAVTADVDTILFAVDYATATSNKAISVTIAVDQTLTTAFNANPSLNTTGINYLPLPAADYKLLSTTVNIPAGAQYAFATLIVQKDLLDPSLSYMLPIKIVSASGVPISANQSIHYYHVIGNDFAGAYTYDYRRFQNGTGPGNNLDGSPAIPSKGQGSAPDITGLGQTGTIISPVTPTEFQMVTDYNGQGVNYDVTFTRTVGANGLITYTNWAVTFLPGDIAKWTAALITNKQAPQFTLAPPATNADPKLFELNYISGGASGRYIDDTYHK